MQYVQNPGGSERAPGFWRLRAWEMQSQICKPKAKKPICKSHRSAFSLEAAANLYFLAKNFIARCTQYDAPTGSN